MNFKYSKKEQQEERDGDRLAVLDQDEVDAEGGFEAEMGGLIEGGNEKEEKVTWMSLPCKKQLIVLTLARLSEPLVQTSLQVNYLSYFLSGDRLVEWRAR